MLKLEAYSLETSLQVLSVVWENTKRPVVTPFDLAALSTQLIFLSATDDHFSKIAHGTQDLRFVTGAGLLQPTTWTGEEAFFILANAQEIFKSLPGEEEEFTELLSKKF